MIKILDIFGPNCLQPAAWDFIPAQGNVELCFAGVVSISPTFANTMFIAVKEHKDRDPTRKFSFTSLSIHARQVLDLSRESIFGEKK